ncbi:MAG TPA: type VI secretion system baseplate subunit TssK [Candidatus Dormibacteraeota bacterium]|nr:type VI secretion system baseplate subunit TssK [Candidatus Dormibacteraeota bacterium]
MQIHWHEGLFLQPHHLQIMQRRLQTDLRAVRTLLNPYCYGIIESRVSLDDLADGRIRFERLRVIMPSGQEVFFPEDATLPALDIKTELVRSTGALDVMLVVPLWTKSRANAFRQGDRVDPRIKLLYVPEETREVADENTGDNPQSVHVRKINARIALKGEDLSDMESLPLLRVARVTGDDPGKARQDPDFVGPSLLLRSTPVIHEMIRELLARLNTSRDERRAKLAAGGLSSDIKWDWTLRLTVLNRFSASMPSLVEEGLVSPFTVYLQLRELLGELLALRPEKDIFDCAPYNHLDPLPAFKELDLKIRELIRPDDVVNVRKVPFETIGPGMLRANMEPDDFVKPTGYFIGVKTTLENTKLGAYLTDGNKFKVMPWSMKDLAIFGLESKEENFPPLELSPRQRYFRIVPTSNQRRWDTLKQDKAMALVWNNSDFNLSEAEFTLFMTLP